MQTTWIKCIKELHVCLVPGSPHTDYKGYARGVGSVLPILFFINFYQL